MIAGHLRVQNGYWQMILGWTDETGKRHTKSVSTHLPERGNKKRAAELLLDTRKRFTEELEDERSTSSMPLESYMRQWLATMLGCVAPGTYEDYRNYVQNSICPYFEAHPVALNKLKAHHIEDYYNSLYRRGASRNTALHHHANLHKALKAAVRRGLLTSNPADLVERPKKEQYIADCYSAEEARQFLSVVQGEKLELVILLTICYGLRRSEVLGLRWGAVHFAEGTLTVNHTVGEELVDGHTQVVGRDKTKRSSSLRTYPLLDHIADRLQSEIQRRYGRGAPPASDYICVDAKGRVLKPSYITNNFPKLLERHHLRPIRFHDLRHTCANLLITERTPLIEVQQWLGHSSIATTADLYAHLAFDVKERSADAIKKI